MASESLAYKYNSIANDINYGEHSQITDQMPIEAVKKRIHAFAWAGRYRLIIDLSACDTDVILQICNWLDENKFARSWLELAPYLLEILW